MKKENYLILLASILLIFVTLFISGCAEQKSISEKFISEEPQMELIEGWQKVEEEPEPEVKQEEIPEAEIEPEPETEPELEPEKAKQEIEQVKAETEKLKTEEEERIAKIKIIDEKLSQLISEAEENANIFSQAKNETDNFIFTVKNKMNKYPDSSLIQQPCQQLINECDNLSFISKKLFDIENSRIETISSFLGSGNIPSADDFSISIARYENYRDQYDLSNTKIDSLMETFLVNEKIVLEEKIERQQKVNQTLNQLTVIIQEIDSQLTILDNQIKDKEAKIEEERNKSVAMSVIEGRVARLVSELNPLIEQWNSFLNTKGRIITLTYKLDDYADYGTPLSAENRTFLLSLGISF